MSKEVDERVVSMQFDNKHFESNVKTSMSTIDKLKEKLNFKGAEKGLENVTASTRKMVRESQNEFGSYKAGIFSLTDAINKMWSVMEYEVAHKMKNVLKDLTLTPITTGLQEYETQLNAVQTILANTESKGSTLEDVNAALDELNKYADLTIYNFTEMTRNIGTFTAAGVGLEESVSAIKGIANLAAVSGSNSQQASTAMYQLSQALSSGTVRLMDWNSVVNAGMGGQVFQDALKETARVHGVAIDDIIEKEGSFRESLSSGWLSSEILTETLEHFTMAAEEGSKEWKDFKKSLVDDGYTEEQAEAILKMANTATEAATKVKTFTQLMDVTKEAIQSGWAQTFEILIGDFEEAKELWTSASDVITGFIGKMNDVRNKLLESAFGKGFTELTNGLEDVLNITKKVTDPIEKTVDALEDLGVIVDKVIVGDFGNGRERFSKLTEAGYNYYKVQNKVNEKLGDAHRYTEQQIADQDKVLSGIKKTTDATEEKKDETVKLTKEQKEELKNLVKMDEAGLENLNLTKEQIDALNDLRKTAEKLGIPLDEFIDNLDKINGRWLWVNSFKNIGNSIIAIFKSIGQAWTEIFDPITADGVFNALSGFHKITSDILHGIEENADNLKRIFKGVFAIVDIIATLFGSTLKLAFQAANAVLSAFGTDVLSVIAWLADGIVVVRDWIDAHNPIIWLFKKLGEVLKKAADAWKVWVKGLKEAKNPGKYIIDGLINGISSGLRKLVSKAKEIATTVIETVKDWLGIHSPSTVFIAIGGFIIAGLVIGLMNGIDILSNIGGDLGSAIIDGLVGVIKNSVNTLKNAANWVGDFLAERFSGFNFGSVTSMLMSGGLILFLYRLTEFIGALTGPLDSISDLIAAVAEGFENLANFCLNIN